jgi:hypothetical protein
MSRDPPVAANPPDDASRELDKFLIAHGGPFYDLQQRLGLLTSAHSTPPGAPRS